MMNREQPHIIVQSNPQPVEPKPPRTIVWLRTSGGQPVKKVSVTRIQRLANNLFLDCSLDFRNAVDNFIKDCSKSQKGSLAKWRRLGANAFERGELPNVTAAAAQTMTVYGAACLTAYVTGWLRASSDATECPDPTLSEHPVPSLALSPQAVTSTEPNTGAPVTP